MKLLLALAPWLAILSHDVHASWIGQGEAGFVLARGNAETNSFNLKLDLSAERNRWKHMVGLAGLYGQSNEITSAERWNTRWQSDFRLSYRLFSFAAVRYEQDRFSGFEFQTSLSSGLGYRLIETPDTQFTASLGAGFRLLRPETLITDEQDAVIERIPGEAARDVVGRGGVDFQHAVTSNTKLIEKLVVESGSDNTFAQNELSLQVSMTKKIALAIGYIVRHNTDPPAELQNTDQLTTVNFVYKIQ